MSAAQEEDAGPSAAEVGEVADATFALLMREHETAVHAAPSSLPGAGPTAWLSELLRPGAAADLVRDWFSAPDDLRPPAERGVPIVASVTAGELVATTVWVHETDRSTGRLSLVLSDLVAAGGGRIPVGEATVRPEVVILPAPGPVPITVTLRVDIGTAPGTYHGWVIADGFADVVLPIRVVVT